MGLAINGDAEGMDALGLGLQKGVSGVFNGVFALVVVVVLGFTVGKHDQQTDFGFHLTEKGGHMADGRRHAGVFTRPDGADPLADDSGIPLVHALDREDLAA